MCKHRGDCKQTFIPTQAAIRDLTVCWIPSLHREQGAVSTTGPRMAFMAVGAKSAGGVRASMGYYYVRCVPGLASQASEATARPQALISASCSSSPQSSSGGW